MSRKFRLFVSAVAICALSPIVYKMSYKPEGLLANRDNTLNKISHIKTETLKVNDASRKAIYRVNYNHYMQMRRSYNYVIDWENENLWHIGLRKEELFLNEINANVKAIEAFSDIVLLEHQSTKSKKDFQEYLNFYKDYAYGASHEVKVLLSNPNQALEAFNKRKLYEGINPRDYIYDSKGKLSIEEEIKITKEHLNRYKEYWSEFIFDHTFYETPQNRKKFDYIYNK